MPGSRSDDRQLAAATLVTTLGRPPAEGGAPLNAPIVLGSTYRADGDIAYARDGNPTVAALEEALGVTEGGTCLHEPDTRGARTPPGRVGTGSTQWARCRAMAVGRAARFEERKARVAAVFGGDADTLRAIAEVFALMEMAWHDCYGEITPPEPVVDDVLLCSEGTLRGLIRAAHLAVIDSRDLAVWASAIRSGSSRTP